MSLTSLIEARHSPLREWFEETLPNLTSLQQAWRAAGPITLEPVGVERRALGTVGTAFDYRIRYSFVVTPVHHLVASHGADGFWLRDIFTEVESGERLRGYEQQNPFDTFAGSLEEFLDQLHPCGGRQLDASAEKTLARYCYALALYDTQFRAGRVPSRLDRLGPAASVEDHLALADEAEVADLCALQRAFIGAHTHLLDQAVTANPTFALSRQLGGADGDLIIGGCLVDIKTTINPRRCVAKRRTSLLATYSRTPTTSTESPTSGFTCPVSRA